jgi:hypothetical protein
MHAHNEQKQVSPIPLQVQVVAGTHKPVISFAVVMDLWIQKFNRVHLCMTN